jgi:hypothetical protein
MKDSKGHGSNPRGNNRQDAIIRGKGIDQRRYGQSSNTPQRSALADAGLPKPRSAPVSLGQSSNAAQMALVAAKLNLGAHQGALHAATAGKNLS